MGSPEQAGCDVSQEKNNGSNVEELPGQVAHNLFTFRKPLVGGGYPGRKRSEQADDK